MHQSLLGTFGLMDSCINGPGKVLKGLKKDGWEGASDSRDAANVTYQQFFALLWGIKGPKMAKKSLSTRVWDAIVWMYVRTVYSKKKDAY